MDLSKLSSNLPLSHPPTDDCLDSINRELSDEFKIGARSIAALYRLSNTKNSILHAKGYLDCLENVISFIDNGNVENLLDLRNLLILKKSELNGKPANENLNSNRENSIKIDGSLNRNAETDSELGLNQTSDQTANRSSDHTLNQATEQNTDTDTNTSTNTNTNTNTNSDANSIIKSKYSLQNSSNKDFKFSINSPSSFNFPPSKVPLSTSPTQLKYYHQVNRNSTHSNIDSMSSDNIPPSKPAKLPDYNLEFKRKNLNCLNPLDSFNSFNSLSSKQINQQFSSDSEFENDNSDGELKYDPIDSSLKRKVVNSNSLAFKKQKFDP